MSSSTDPAFTDSQILSYLGLPDPCDPSPTADPIQFLIQHIGQLPPHLLLLFSSITTPKQRTAIPAIINRRLKYTNSNPNELEFAAAKSAWPALWQGRERCGLEEGKDEEEWVKSGFMGGSVKHVGKLGALLGGYEEEREAERVRVSRRNRVADDDFIPEEDSESDVEFDLMTNGTQEENNEDVNASFELLVKERFIYGLLNATCYDVVDWDESLDSDDDRNKEERWFDEDDE